MKKNNNWILPITMAGLAIHTFNNKVFSLSKEKLRKKELTQKLNKIRPLSIGQASRISGVSPADISVLLVYIEQLRQQKKRDEVK